MRFLKIILAVGFLLPLVGCMQYQSRRYSVAITNKTPQPLTIGLVKNGGPYEDWWRKPEADAIAVPGGRYRPWGVVLPPGRTGDLQQKGKFAPGVLGILRVYYGQHSSTDLLGISSGDPDRLDVPLEPGVNIITITRSDGKMIPALTRPMPPVVK